MKVLILTNRVPFPPNSGYPIVVYNTIKGLLRLGVEVTLFSINPIKNKVDVEDIYDPIFESIKFHSFSLDTEVNVIIPAIIDSLSRAFTKLRLPVFPVSLNREILIESTPTIVVATEIISE